MTIALYKGLKGRSKWEPSPEVIPKASNRFAMLFSLVSIILLMCFLQGPNHSSVVAITMVIALLIGFVAYQDYHYLTSARIYQKPGVNKRGQPITVNVLVGASEDLRPEIKAQLQQNPSETIQDLINGCGGNLEVLWHKDVLAKARRRYERDYIFMVAGGTLAIACAGILGSQLLPSSRT
jgi:hypothetical protein